MKKQDSSASISPIYYCKNCEWPVVFACCNNEFRNYKDAGKFDWWLYCSNKGCENHDGEGTYSPVIDMKWLKKVKDDK